jgi:hypothetical protein
MCTQKKVVELFDVTVDEYVKEKMQIAVLVCMKREKVIRSVEVLHLYFCRVKLER